MARCELDYSLHLGILILQSDRAGETPYNFTVWGLKPFLHLRNRTRRCWGRRFVPVCPFVPDWSTSCRCVAMRRIGGIIGLS